MKLDKTNEAWKRRVNMGSHGRVIRLDPAARGKVNRKFWKPIKEYMSGTCETGNLNGPHDGEKSLTLGPVKLQLFGPKSKKRRYVCVATYVKCAPRDPEMVMMTGVGTHPVWHES
jgi:hypothetical protein